MLTLISLILTVISPAADALETNINVHQSSIRISFPQNSEGSPCMEFNSSAEFLAAEIEIIAGPGLDAGRENEFGYLYKLIPERKQNVRFRGLQLHDRSNTVEIRTKSGESLAEVFDRNSHGSEATFIRLNPTCE